MSDSRNESFDLGKTVQDVANNDIVHTAGYFVPGLGTGMLAADSYNDFSKGDWGMGLVDLGLTGLDFVPGGSIVAGAVKGAKAATRVASKAVPKVLKGTKKEYPNLLKPGTKLTGKNLDPEAKGLKGLPKAEKVVKNTAKAGKGGKVGAFVNGLLVADALNGGGGTPDAGLGAGATDRMLNGAVSRSAAFQAGASS